MLASAFDLSAAAPVVAPVLIAPFTAKILVMALAILVVVAVTDLLAPQGPRR